MCHLSIGTSRGGKIHTYEKESWYLLRDIFKISDVHPCLFYKGAPPPSRSWENNPSQHMARYETGAL